VLRHVGERLRTDEVGGSLDRGRKPRGGDGNLDGNRGPSGEFTDRRPQPALGQRRGMHPARELAELGTGCVEPRADVSQRLASVSEQLRHVGEPPLGALPELAPNAGPPFLGPHAQPAPRSPPPTNPWPHFSLKPPVPNPRP